MRLTTTELENISSNKYRLANGSRKDDEKRIYEWISVDSSRDHRHIQSYVEERERESVTRSNAVGSRRRRRRRRRRSAGLIALV